MLIKSTEVLCDPENNIVNDPRYSQPLCTALQVALVDQLEEWGIMPVNGVIGHSSGKTEED